MIIGIIKNDKEIKGNCEIKEIVNSYNKVLTVVCDGMPATVNDSIIYECDDCNKVSSIHKRNFFKGKKNISCLCEKCAIKETSINKYGVPSPNQVGSVKQKQQKNSNKKYKSGTFRREKKTQNKEELYKLRSENAKASWKKGKYKNVDRSAIMKKAWQDPIKRRNILAGMNTLARKQKYSEAAKKLWLNPEFRKKMSKLGIRISKFQLDVYNSLDKNKWLLEYPIPGTIFTTDIYNPETKEIIECYGDYWHCNPKKYSKDFYHKRAHKSAKDIWKKDKMREKELQKLGYKMKIIWESDWV